MNILERMAVNGAEERIASFRAMQQRDYEFKIAHAEETAYKFLEHPQIDGMAYVAVGGLETVAFFSDGCWSRLIFPAISFDKTGQPSSLITLTLERSGLSAVTPSSICTRWILLSSNTDTETAGRSIPIERRKQSSVMLSRPPTAT